MRGCVFERRNVDKNERTLTFHSTQVRERFKALHSNRINTNGEFHIQSERHRTQEHNLEDAFAKVRGSLSHSFHSPLLHLSFQSESHISYWSLSLLTIILLSFASFLSLLPSPATSAPSVHRCGHTPPQRAHCHVSASLVHARSKRREAEAIGRQKTSRAKG